MKKFFLLIILSFMLPLGVMASSGSVTMYRGTIGGGWNGGGNSSVPIPQVTYDDNIVSISCDSLLHDVQVVIKDEDDRVMYSGSINLNANVQILNVPQSFNQRIFSIELFAREDCFYGYFTM